MRPIRYPARRPAHNPTRRPARHAARDPARRAWPVAACHPALYPARINSSKIRLLNYYEHSAGIHVRSYRGVERLDTASVGAPLTDSLALGEDEEVAEKSK